MWVNYLETEQPKEEMSDREALMKYMKMQLNLENTTLDHSLS